MGRPYKDGNGTGSSLSANESVIWGTISPKTANSGSSCSGSSATTTVSSCKPMMIPVAKSATANTPASTPVIRAEEKYAYFMNAAPPYLTSPLYTVCIRHLYQHGSSS